jgi:hypothetical protein
VKYQWDDTATALVLRQCFFNGLWFGVRELLLAFLAVPEFDRFANALPAQEILLEECGFD